MESLEIVTKVFGTNACVNVVDVPLQLGVTDCGLFVVAYMTSLAFGEYPSDIKYNQEVLSRAETNIQIVRIFARLHWYSNT